MSILAALPPDFIDWVGQVDPSVQIWIVGGAVRDYFLDRSIGDLDFAVSPPALPIAREVASLLDGKLYILDHERGTVRVLLEHDGELHRRLDFSELRAPTIEADLRSRDFSVNSLAFDLRFPERLIDPCSGLQDLKDHILRVSHPGSIAADPLRIVRGIRLACELVLQIEAETRDQMKSGAPLVSKISRERIREEVFRVLALRKSAQAIHLLTRFGLVPTLLGREISKLKRHDSVPTYLAELRALGRILEVLGHEFQPDGAADASLGMLTWQLGRFREPLHAHLLEELTVDRRRRELLILGLWAAGEIKMAGAELDPANTALWLGGSLRLSQKEVIWQERFLAGLDAVDLLAADPLGIYRFFRDYQDAGVASALAHLARCLAYHLPSPPLEMWALEIEKVRALMEAYYERESTIAPSSIVTGDDLIRECGLSPGPQVGELLELVREAQVRGEIENKEQALDWVHRWLEK